MPIKESAFSETQASCLRLCGGNGLGCPGDLSVPTVVQHRLKACVPLKNTFLRERLQLLFIKRVFMDYKTAADPDALLKVLSEHERAIARLYQAYSVRFDEFAVFWAGLAHEELKHAACLSEVRTLLREDSEIVIVERFSMDAVRFSIRYVNALTERAAEPDFELINALSLAMKLEEALLEKNFFEVLSGDGQEVREALEFLSNETERHFQVLHHTLEYHKNGMGLQ